MSRKPRSFREAARVSLEERWYPISQAGSIDEMNKIFEDTWCAMCDLAWEKRIADCSGCPLNDHSLVNDHSLDDFCCTEWQHWLKEIKNHNYENALHWAKRLVKRLERIAGIGK